MVVDIAKKRQRDLGMGWMVCQSKNVTEMSLYYREGYISAGEMSISRRFTLSFVVLFRFNALNILKRQGIGFELK